MPILQYETRVSPEGYITLPPIPEYHDRKVVVRVHEEIERKIAELSDISGKTPEQDFLDFCEELDMPALSDDDVDRIKYERLKEKYL
jgi:hypothetical protein